MEKTSKEYAEKLARENVIYGESMGNYVFGYMKAVEETNVKGLLEALKECLDGVKELNSEFQSGWEETITKTINAINKAKL